MNAFLHYLLGLNHYRNAERGTIHIANIIKCKGCKTFLLLFTSLRTVFLLTACLKRQRGVLIIYTTKNRSPKLWNKLSQLNVFIKLFFPNKARRQSYLIFTVDKQTQPIFRNSFKFPRTGFLSCFSYSLTSDTKSKLEWCFPCTCRTQRSLTGFLCNSKPIR